jgi:hypothetical protein
LSFKAICRLCPLVLLAAVLTLAAQQAMAGTALAAVLPDAPLPAQSTQSSSTTAPQPIPASAPHYAPRLARYIQPYQVTRQLSAKEKLALSVREQLRPYAFSTEVLAAGWEHLRDGNPKYGTDSAGFGERLGAAAIQQTSNAIFSDGAFPALLRQDPRYYRKGSGKFLARVAYSATRGVVTRTDAGNPAPNYSRILGSASAYALTMTYYPAVSATWGQTAKGWSVSFLTGALGNQVHEFAPDVRAWIRRRHRT